MSAARTPAAGEEEAAVTDTTVIPRLPPERLPGAPAKKSFSLRQIGPLLAGGAFGAAAGYVGVKFGADFLVPGLPKPYLLLHVVFLPLLWLVAVAFHELGHLVGGWVGGGRFLIYVVGPLMWKRVPSGVTFSWNTNVNTFGGLAACLPVDAARATPRSTALLIVGGPVFSLVLVVAAAWLGAALAPHAAGVPAILAQHLAMHLAAISALIFLVTVVPATGGGFKTDGLRFFQLVRGDARSEQENAVMTLTTLSLAGVRPADYDPRVVARALALRDGSLFDLYAHLTVAHHFIDLGQPGRAQALLDHALAGEARLAPFARDTARCDYAWLLAAHTPDVAAARAWLDSAGPIEIDPATRLRAEAAVLLAEGRRTEAAAKAREGLHALEHRSLSPVKNRFAEEQLEALLRRAEAGA